MKTGAVTGAHGEDCGGPESVRDLDPKRHLQPETEDKAEDFSEADIKDKTETLGWSPESIITSCFNLEES